MDDIKSISKKINSKIGKHHYYYISNEIEHGLGLSDYIENFTHVCLNDNYVVDYLKKEKKRVLCLDREKEKIRSSAMLLEKVDIKKGDYVQTFKISPQLEKLVLQKKANLVNTTTQLNWMFERKIPQGNYFLNANINTPKFVSGKLLLLDFKSLKRELGEELVVQFDRGHTGSGTHFVHKESQYLAIVQKFPQREARISSKVEGKTYTVNACMTKRGLFCGGISEQFTGVEGLVAEKGGTVGNNFNHDLPEIAVSKLKEELSKVEFLHARFGFRGLFGLDFIWNENLKEIFVIEMNARQTMSVPFHFALQVMNNQVPLGILHVADFLSLDIDLNPSDYNDVGLSKIEASQIFKRNMLDDDFEISSEMKTGEYILGIDDQPRFLRECYSIRKISTENILFIAQKNGQKIKHGGEILRVQILSENTKNLFKFFQILRKL